MTSFLHSQNSLTGTEVPGGTCGTEGEQERLKFVLAPSDCESSPVPTFFQMPARLAGGTVAYGGRHEVKRAGGLRIADVHAGYRLSQVRPNGIDASWVGGPGSVSFPMISWLSAK
jgi:hypothetical protein